MTGVVFTLLPHDVKRGELEATLGTLGSGDISYAISVGYTQPRTTKPTEIAPPVSLIQQTIPSLIVRHAFLCLRSRKGRVQVPREAARPE